MTLPLTGTTVAPLWRRLAAIFYDSFLIFAIWIVVGFLVASAFGIDQARTLDGEVVVLDPLYRWTLFAAMLASAFLFFGWFWTNSGQTLGMQAWRIKLQSNDGRTLSWKQVAQRYLTAPVAFAALGIGYWWALFDSEKRSWPDLSSGSRVVRVQL